MQVANEVPLQREQKGGVETVMDEAHFPKHFTLHYVGSPWQKGACMTRSLIQCGQEGSCQQHFARHALSSALASSHSSL